MSEDLLYHITRKRDLPDVFQNGIKRSDQSLAARIADRQIQRADDDPNDPVIQEVVSRIEQRFDEAVEDAKFHLDGTGEFPTHRDAVFFWASDATAYTQAFTAPWKAFIVAVDPDSFPAGCTCAIGPVLDLREIYQDFYNTALDRASVAEDAAFENAKLWWRKVSEWEGQRHFKHHVWCGCDVPPHAIEYASDPDTGERWNDVGDGLQMELDDFEE